MNDANDLQNGGEIENRGSKTQRRSPPLNTHITNNVTLLATFKRNGRSWLFEAWDKPVFGIISIWVSILV